MRKCSNSPLALDGKARQSASCSVCCPRHYFLPLAVSPGASTATELLAAAIAAAVDILPLLLMMMPLPMAAALQCPFLTTCQSKACPIVHHIGAYTLL